MFQGITKLTELSKKCEGTVSEVSIDINSATLGVMSYAIRLKINGTTTAFFSFDESSLVAADLLLNDIAEMINRQLLIHNLLPSEAA